MSGSSRSHSSISKKSAFSPSERELLIALIRARPILEDKRTNNTNIMLKKKAWEDLCSVFNSKPHIQIRSCQQLKRCWENMKAARKKELSQKFSKGGAEGDCSMMDMRVPGDTMADYNTSDADDHTEADPLDGDMTHMADNKRFIEVMDVVLTEVDENNPSANKRSYKETFNAASGKRLKNEAHARLKRIVMNIRHDKELHELRMDRERILIDLGKVFIEREKNTKEFEKQIQSLQIEKLQLELDLLKKTMQDH